LRNVTGLQGGADGRLMIVRNIGSFDLVLKDQSASSTAANRFSFGGADVTVHAGASVFLQYDSTLSRWTSITVATRKMLDAAPIEALQSNNLVINGNCEIAQEFGTTGVNAVSGSGNYFVDMMLGLYVHAANTAVITYKQLPAASFPAPLPGYNFGAQIKATTLMSPANGDFANYTYRFEGTRVAKLGFGTASAQPVSYGFWFYSTVSGVIVCGLANAATNRFFQQEQTVAAGWNWLTGTIPGDVTGTWVTDNTLAWLFSISIVGKAAALSTPGSWVASTTGQTTNQTSLFRSDRRPTTRGVGPGAAYNRRSAIRHPEWPGEQSGVTIGIGYDVGQASKRAVPRRLERQDSRRDGQRAGEMLRRDRPAARAAGAQSCARGRRSLGDRARRVLQPRRAALSRDAARAPCLASSSWRRIARACCCRSRSTAAPRLRARRRALCRNARDQGLRQDPATWRGSRR
jgi:hypothetical protein